MVDNFPFGIIVLTRWSIDFVLNDHSMDSLSKSWLHHHKFIYNIPTFIWSSCIPERSRTIINLLYYYRRMIRVIRIRMTLKIHIFFFFKFLKRKKDYTKKKIFKIIEFWELCKNVIIAFSPFNVWVYHNFIIIYDIQTELYKIL